MSTELPLEAYNAWLFKEDGKYLGLLYKVPSQNQYILRIIPLEKGVNGLATYETGKLHSYTLYCKAQEFLRTRNFYEIGKRDVKALLSKYNLRVAWPDEDWSGFEPISIGRPTKADPLVERMFFRLSAKQANELQKHQLPQEVSLGITARRLLLQYLEDLALRQEYEENAEFCCIKCGATCDEKKT